MTFFIGYCLQAQIIERPLPILQKQVISLSATGQQQTQNTLSIPFWDDFSTSRFLPDAEKWLYGEHVRISNSTAIKSPSLNTAVFDGVDVNGIPYNARSILNGKTDSLVSHPFDLSSIPSDQADSVFFSFFWQANGRGELPDPEDSLVLQFKNNALHWETVWSTGGGIDVVSEDFQQELIQVESKFFHQQFQVKFQSFSRLSGAFDTWLVDYVFMDDQRHPGDSAYVDRALTVNPSFLTAPYSAMPTEQFFANPSAYVQETQTEFVNLNSSFQPIAYNTFVRDLIANEEVERLNDGRIANPIPGAFERRTFDSPALNPALLNALADSLWLETTYSIRSGDGFFVEDINPGVDTTFNTNIDFRVNDTVRTITILNDYFAYDDGEPDFAAGINQAGGQLAYAYFAETEALLTHIDINFPFVQQAGESIQIKVWNQGIDGPGEELVSQSFSVLRPDGIGDLRAYLLDSPVVVQDTFFIGFQQATNEFLAVGLDKQIDSGDKMHFNVSGSWQRNEFVKGSFLMRPRFDKAIAAALPGENPVGGSPVNVFPNPSEGRYFIVGEVDRIQVLDRQGQERNVPWQKVENGAWVDLSTQQKGIYLLRIWQGERPQTKRIILK